mgnify:CR=1 FL=1
MLKKLLGGLAVAMTVAISPLAAQAADSMRFAVTDIGGMEELQREFGPFKKVLEDITGLDVQFFAVNSRTAAVEAMNAKQVDFVLTGPAEYVVFRARTNAKVVVGWQRPDYFAQIVTLADGPIKGVSDLKGQKVSFGSVGSTSQHLGPAQALADFGLIYNKDYQPQIISRNIAIEALIRGDIQAVGMNFTHLQKVRKAFPDHAFTVVARGRDLPNDVLVASPDVSDALFKKVRNAFAKDGDKLIAAVVKGKDNEKYLGGHFLASIEDRDYDYVRSMYRTIGVNSFGKFVGE